MPFAKKYQFTMRIPGPGERLGDYAVESCQVEHDERGDGTIVYPISLVVVGPGGMQGVRKAIREHLDHGRTTFSGFGNPYQLRFGGFQVGSLGSSRYRVTAQGTGVRIDLERELQRFVAYAKLRRRPAGATLIPAYIQDYRKDVTRKGPELEY